MRGHLKPIRSKGEPRIRCLGISLPGSNKGKKFSSVSRTNQERKTKKINSKAMIGQEGRIEVKIEVKVAMTNVMATDLFGPN